MYIGILPTYYEVYAIGGTEEEVKKNIVKGYKKAFPEKEGRAVKATFKDLNEYFGVSIYKIPLSVGYAIEGQATE
jgi:hypothetical protein